MNAASKTSDRAVYTFGRFQPPTIGHGLLYDSVLAEAGGGDAFVFVSSKVNDMPALIKSRAQKDMLAACARAGASGAAGFGACFQSWAANENPLSVEQKIKYLNKMHNGKALRFINTTACGCPTFYNAAEALAALGYKEIVLLVGSDRVARFAAVFAGAPLAGVSVVVKGAGAARKAASNGSIAGISGTFLRQLAVMGDFERFKAGLVVGAMTDADINGLMNDIRVGLGLPGLPGFASSGGKRKTRRLNKGRM